MSKKTSIIVAPYPKLRTDGKVNAKCYPYWIILFDMLSEYEVIQLVGPGEVPIPSGKHVEHFHTKSLIDVERKLKNSDLFLCVDNYLQHMAHYLGKRGIALYGPSNPKIFGYPENENLYVSEKYFRPFQFQTWQEWDYNPEAFVKPEEVIFSINKITSGF